MNDLQIARDLRSAANYLRNHGWSKQDFGRDGEARCLAGALCSVQRDRTGVVGMLFRSHWPAAEAMGFESGFAMVGPIAHWNDAKWRTLNEVLDRLESTALALEIRHLSHETQAPLEVAVTPELVGV